MTAAVLQFNPIHIRKLNDQYLEQQEKDMINVSFDNAYRDRMVALLNTEHPFRAVRLAEIFNRENGFMLIPDDVIRGWKNQIMKKGNSKKENPQIEKLEIKLQQLETGYRELLGIGK